MAIRPKEGEEESEESEEEGAEEGGRGERIKVDKEDEKMKRTADPRRPGDRRKRRWRITAAPHLPYKN